VTEGIDQKEMKATSRSLSNIVGNAAEEGRGEKEKKREIVFIRVCRHESRHLTTFLDWMMCLLYHTAFTMTDSAPNP
jgi:hypothetical protein